jgi:hypothetical protein
MLSNAEREKLVLDLYNQGKHIRQIPKEAKSHFGISGYQYCIKERGSQR